MKPGKTLEQLTTEIELQNSMKRDVIASVRSLEIDPGNKIVIPASAKNPAIAYSMSDFFQGQAAAHLNYPFAFWQRSRDMFPEEWRAMVQAMLHSDTSKRMVRMLGGDARAFLSTSYRVLDNDVIAAAAVKAVNNAKGWQVVSSEITPSKMFIKVITPTEGEIRKGDIVRSGFILTNSEVGNGAVTVLPLIERLVCTNGMVINEAAMRRTHLTRAQLGDGRDASELFSDRTKQLSDAALLSQLADVIRSTVDTNKFEMRLNKYRETTEQKIDGAVEEVVEVTAQRFGFMENEKQSVLRNLISGADLTRYGMIQAVTQAAQDEEVNYARSVELETVGGELLNLPDREWINIAATKKAPKRRGTN